MVCVSFGLFHAYEPSLTLVRGCFHLLAIFYNFPLLPGRLRLKQIYLLKNIASSLAFLLTGFVYPLARAHWGFFGLPVGVEMMTLVFAGAFVFLLALGITVIFDLRDAAGDASAGIETFPVVLGPELTVTIVDRALAFAAVLLVVGYATHFVPWRILVMAAAPLAVLLAYRRGLPVTALVCGLMIVYHLWIWLRLPGWI
jgi:4-hydroxybenzoate polyprenyltransferase